MAEIFDGRDRSGGLVIRNTPHYHMQLAKAFENEGRLDEAVESLKQACEQWRDAWLAASGVPSETILSAEMLETDLLVQLPGLITRYNEARNIEGTAGSRKMDTLEQSLILAQKARFCLSVLEDGSTDRLIRYRNSS